MVYIRGKNDEDLSDTEVLLAKIYASVLGLAEIDVFTNFHDMGGNSIIATHLLKLIDTHFRDLVDISDIFSYSSIDEMASYITEKRTRMAPTSTGRLEDMLDHVFENGGSFDAIIEQI